MTFDDLFIESKKFSFPIFGNYMNLVYPHQLFYYNVIFKTFNTSYIFRVRV